MVKGAREREDNGSLPMLLRDERADACVHCAFAFG